MQEISQKDNSLRTRGCITFKSQPILGSVYPGECISVYTLSTVGKLWVCTWIEYDPG